MEENSDSIDSLPWYDSLAWYDKLFIAKKLINSLIPKNYEHSSDVKEIICFTDNLRNLTPTEKMKMSLQLLNEVKQDYFAEIKIKMKQNSPINIDFLAGFLLALALIALPVVIKTVVPEYVAEVTQWD